MKSKLPVVLWFAAITAVAMPAYAQTAALMNEGQRAMMAHDYETAKEKFKLVLAQDAHNQVAANYLRIIAVSEAKAGTGASLEKQLKALNVSVEFKEATFAAVLERLKQEAVRVSNGAAKVSFVVAPAVNGNTAITLNLSNTPFTEVLHYLGELANVQFVFERYAIMVKPK